MQSELPYPTTITNPKSIIVFGARKATVILDIGDGDMELLRQRLCMLEEMNDIVFEQLGLKQLSSGNVGDLGCGTGAVARYGCEFLPQFGWHAITISRDKRIKLRAPLLPGPSMSKTGQVGIRSIMAIITYFPGRRNFLMQLFSW